MKEKESPPSAPIVFRGRANVVIYDNNEVDVRMPESNPDMKLEKLAENSSGVLSKSPSGKRPKYLLRLAVPADSPDPASEIVSAAERLTKQIALPKKPTIPTRGRWLEKSDTLQIRADPHTKEVTIVAKLPLVFTQEMIETFNNQTIQQVTRCLVMQKATIAELVSAMRRCSTQSSDDQT